MGAGWIFVLIFCVLLVLWLVIPPQRQDSPLEKRMHAAAVRAKELQDQGMPSQEAFQKSAEEYGLESRKST
jgi:hypothetical protein